MKPLRPYQEDALGAIFDYWARQGGNPLVELATGCGKSLVIARLVHDIHQQWPSMRILMLVHSRELVAQNVAELKGEWPDAPIGINSAALGRRDYRNPILFASIQSVYRDAANIGPRDLVLVDECHMLPPKGEGMYRTLLEGLRERTPDLRVVGFTATPYRLGSGRLDEGEGRMFDDIVYTYDIGRGVEDGYLTPLIARPAEAEISVQGVGRRGGEFIESDLAAIVEDDELIRRAAAEIVALGADRRAWIAFCVNVAHAEAVASAIRDHGISAAVVSGETPKVERNGLIASFKAGGIRCLVSVNVLSIGFNAPQVDLIALLRPTLSTGLYVQQLGRGTRCIGPNIEASIAAGKSNCLVLDFSGNVRRHGPVDAITVGGREKGSSDDTAAGVKPDTVRAKKCPACGFYAAPSALECANPACDHRWPPPPAKHEAKPELDVVIMAGRMPPAAVEFLDVRDIHFDEHFKPGKPSSFKVTYVVGLKTYSEWVCLEHDGYTREKAERWWRTMSGGQPAPATISEALFRTDELMRVLAIAVKLKGEFWSVTHYRCEDGDGESVLIDPSMRVRREDGTLVVPTPMPIQQQPAASLTQLLDDEIPF